ncbi:MAG: hypothetical protein GX228_06730 [Firmicutes bacterium]|jgi:hypothetical protein|nr:hypothetical protein [Bacillota bacterium]NLL88606.1 hypothetical protein [Bacillota bacterium]HKM17329.1 hypothetical protein [Limnochordia bacterium]
MLSAPKLGALMGVNWMTIILIVVINTLLIKFLWGLVIPYIFPRVVEEGYIRGEISWLGALGLSILLGILS